MDISRNQFFFAGLLCLLLGAQFRLIDSLELTPEFTQFLAERTGHPLAAVGATTQALTPSEKPMVEKDRPSARAARLGAALGRGRARVAQHGHEEGRLSPPVIRAGTSAPSTPSPSTRRS